MGFKPYPDLAKIEIGEPGIYDMLNRSVLEFSEKNNLAVLLHIPRKNRLKSSENQQELLEITSNYPSC